MQRLEPDEAQAVARLAAERHAATPSAGPTVEGLADALGLPQSEVERLLAEVRSRRVAPPTFEATAPRRRFGDKSAAISAGIVLALVLVVAAILGARFLMLDRNVPIAAAPSPPEAVAVPGFPDDGSQDVVIERDGKRVRIRHDEKGGATLKIDQSGS